MRTPVPPPPPPRAVAEAQWQAQGKTTETTEQVVPNISDLPLAAAAWAHGAAQWWPLPQHPGGQAEGASRREEDVVWSTPSQLSASDMFDLGYYSSDEQEKDDSDQEPYGEPSPESNENAPGPAGWNDNNSDSDSDSGSDSETNNEPRRQRSKRPRPVSDDDEDADDEREEGDIHFQTPLSSRPKKKLRKGGAKFHPRRELIPSLPRPAESHWAAGFQGQDLDEPTTAFDADDEDESTTAVDDDGRDDYDEDGDEEATIRSATLAGDDDEDEDEDEPLRYSGKS